jgi:phosphoribosylaminoimidazole (AIR) synthetase
MLRTKVKDSSIDIKDGRKIDRRINEKVKRTNSNTIIIPIVLLGKARRQQ